jgi:hypothetical protein
MTLIFSPPPVHINKRLTSLIRPHYVIITCTVAEKILRKDPTAPNLVVHKFGGPSRPDFTLPFWSLELRGGS